MSDRIKRLRKLAKISQEDLGKRAGVTKSAVSQWENGNTKNLKGENLLAIAKALNTSIEYLLTGKEVPMKNAEPIKTDLSRKIPLVSKVSAGSWLDSPDNFAPGDADDWVAAPADKHGARTFALKVQGDSMTSPYPKEKSYLHGMIIYVDPDQEIFNGCEVVARTLDGEYVFKTYIEDMGKKYLKPINPHYDKVEIAEGIVICGLVIGAYFSTR